MVKAGAVVIDVGINKLGDKIVGDVDLKELKKSILHNSGSGGVNLTVAMLFSNI